MFSSPCLLLFCLLHVAVCSASFGCAVRSVSKSEVDALGVIIISRGCFERCCSKKKTPPYPSFLTSVSFVTLRNRRPTLPRAPTYRTPSEASPRRRCGQASRFVWTLARESLFFVVGEEVPEPDAGPPAGDADAPLRPLHTIAQRSRRRREEGWTVSFKSSPFYLFSKNSGTVPLSLVYVVSFVSSLLASVLSAVGFFDLFTQSLNEVVAAAKRDGRSINSYILSPLFNMCSLCIVCRLVKGALCAYVKRLRVSYNQNDETLSRSSLRYLSKANLAIAVHCSCRAPLSMIVLFDLFTQSLNEVVAAAKRDGRSVLNHLLSISSLRTVVQSL